MRGTYRKNIRHVKSCHALFPLQSWPANTPSITRGTSGRSADNAVSSTSGVVHHFPAHKHKRPNDCSSDDDVETQDVRRRKSDGGGSKGKKLVKDKESGGFIGPRRPSTPSGKSGGKNDEEHESSQSRRLAALSQFQVPSGETLLRMGSL